MTPGACTPDERRARWVLCLAATAALALLGFAGCVPGDLGVGCAEREPIHEQIKAVLRETIALDDEAIAILRAQVADLREENQRLTAALRGLR